ncbi:MAG: GAF domain-containing protein [Desulfobulbus sp.]|jgi:HD-GYP domain-containing protein (c-di-GMP phosphodiesterase class II)|uniref:HD domain-containing phosphohydrolase n=1 Tax=Desulfobulbus sp. TaxID=895 RepID=UPI002848D724|nr:HD domain-containing phosphohydrolase [Desulfobulbus sp.]MDR2550258.1 GAF domain-containing protein [Desulfobulbus sp.]
MPDPANNHPRHLLGLRGYFGLFCAAVLLVAGTCMTGIGYHVVNRTINAAVEQKADAIGRSVERVLINNISQPSRNFVAAFSHGPVPQTRSPEERTQYLPLLQAALQAYHLFEELFVGYDNGDFFLVKLLKNERDRLYFAGPPGSALLVREVRGDRVPSLSEYFFYDVQLRLLEKRTDFFDQGYDPRLRNWYQEAMRTTGPVETNATLLVDHYAVGIFVAQKSLNGRAVAGLTLHVDQLSSLLASELPTPGSRLALFRPDATLLASSRGMLLNKSGHQKLRDVEDLSSVIRQGLKKYQQGLRTSSLRIENGASNTGLIVTEDQREWLLIMEEMEISNQPNDFMVLAIPRDELLAAENVFWHYTLLGMFGVILLVAPVAWLAGQYISQPLRIMTARTHPFYEKPDDFAQGYPHSYLSEVALLTHGLQSMREHQQKFLGLLSMVGQERDLHVLLQRILKEIIAMVDPEGVLLVITDGKNGLDKEFLFCWDDDEVTVLPMASVNHLPRQTYAICRAMDGNCTIRDRIEPHDPRSRLPGPAPGFNDPSVTCLHLLCFPLRDRMGAPLGGITFFKRDRDGSGGFSPEETAFLETLVKVAAVVLETQTLIKNQFDLRDAFIRILAGAIDTKSPHTGSHCARVPVIFHMLLEAADQSEEGPLKDFRLDDALLEEARLAAWLHDCGKVTTPEYVMDKATKLETLYDRLHEIRTRFEVLKRDAEIDSLRARLEGADAQEGQRKLEEIWQEIDDDFAFVAVCNIGSEYISDEDLARLAAIGRRTWVRTLDKRLGVSRDERARMEQAGVPAPPVREFLLMDNREHIIARGPQDRIPPDNPWGFKLNVPEALYNRGELYNLGIRRGTLTEEERYKINDHITQTIIMLHSLPLPEHLQQIPEIAGAHHETMDGRGYPRGLKREEMSWAARMMAIADIFEALTAWDRPYKNSKTLRETLDIMDGFKQRHHIDPDLYDLFLKANIPQRYAAKHLRPEQNDMA